MPAKKSPPDRRIARTREALHGAFIDLILEKGYDGMTVNDIVERANIARSTFYAHHGSKESVLLDGIGNLRELLTKAQRDASDAGNGSESWLGFSRALFEHVEGHRDLYHAFMGDRGGAIMTNAVRQMLGRLVRRELTEAAAAQKNQSVPLDAAVRFTTDSLLAVMIWCVEAKPPISAAEGNRVFRQLIEPALAANGFGPG